MKPARITFLALFTIGILGGVSNSWQDSVGSKYLGGSQLRSTLESLFSLSGIIDYFVVPTMAALYASMIVAGYQKFIKQRVKDKFKAVSIIFTVIFGLIGFVLLSFLLAALTV